VSTHRSGMSLPYGLRLGEGVEKREIGLQLVDWESILQM
jgi:hypothetical protein